MKTDKVEGNKVRLMSWAIQAEREGKNLVLFKGAYLNNFYFHFTPSDNCQIYATENEKL